MTSSSHQEASWKDDQVWEMISQASLPLDGATTVRNFHHTSFLGFLLPSKYCWEDDQPWEMLSQAYLPSGYPPGWSHYPYLVNIYMLAYLSIILLAGPKSVTTKVFEIKSEKNTRSVGCQPQSIPLNAAANGRELSKKCSIFALGQGEHASSSAD